MIYPNTDLRRDADYPSRRSNDGIIIGMKGMERQIDLYLATPDDRTHPLASPILAETLAGLPPALLITCEADPLLDEGEALGARLAEAGVPLRRECFAGMIHAFLQMGGHIDATERLLTLIAEWLGGLAPVAAG